MKTRWLLPVAFISLLGIVLAAHPLQQFSLRSATKEAGRANSAGQRHSGQESPQSTTNQRSVADTVYERVNPAVVMAYGADGVGSGIIVRSDGLILTNKHLVDNSANVKVKTSTGAVYDGKVVDFDLRYDLALVKLKTPSLKLAIAQLASVSLKSGDRVYAIGSPAGKAGTMTSGNFLRTTQHGSLQTSVGLLQPGNSGGPLLNAKGEVIGVNKGLLDDKSGLATPIAAAKTLIDRYDTVNKPRH